MFLEGIEEHDIEHLEDMSHMSVKNNDPDARIRENRNNIIRDMRSTIIHHENRFACVELFGVS
jgi:hypothetical protein